LGAWLDHLIVQLDLTTPQAWFLEIAGRLCRMARDPSRKHCSLLRTGRGLAEPHSGCLPIACADFGRLSGMADVAEIELLRCEYAAVCMRPAYAPLWEKHDQEGIKQCPEQ